MKKNYVVAAMLAAVVGCGLVSCSQNEEIANESGSEIVKGVLQVHPYCAGTDSRSTSGFNQPKTEFEIGDKLGVFVGIGAPTTLYPGTTGNIPATMASDKWDMEKIALKNQEATVWAYYPYAEGSDNASAIPVKINPETDYLYGKSATNATFTNPNVDIPMKHAMTQFVFRLIMDDSDNYVGEGLVSSLSLIATNNTTLYTEGTMNLAAPNPDKVASGTNGTTRISFAPNIVKPTANGETNEFAAIMIPTHISSNVVTLEVVIDGNKFTAPLPESDWKSGYRNIYTYTLVDNSLTIGGGEDGTGTDGITIEEWKNTSESSVTLTPVE